MKQKEHVIEPSNSFLLWEIFDLNPHARCKVNWWKRSWKANLIRKKSVNKHKCIDIIKVHKSFVDYNWTHPLWPRSCLQFMVTVGFRRRRLPTEARRLQPRCLFIYTTFYPLNVCILLLFFLKTSLWPAVPPYLSSLHAWTFRPL